MMKKWKLMNVAQIRLTQNGVAQEVRAHCVEITSEPHLSLITAYSLFDDENSPRLEITPRIINRFRIPGPIDVIDALEHDRASDGGGQKWLVLSEHVNLAISPYREEHIWLDQSFGRDPVLTDDLRHLYGQRRGCLFSLVLHERLLRCTPEGDPASRAQHRQMIVDMRDVIDQIEKRICLLEAKKV